MLVQPKDIADLRSAAPDCDETERLKALLAALRGERDPMFLTRDDIEPVLHWKLGRQYGRVRHHLANNTDDAYRIITQAALSIKLTDSVYELRLRTGALTALAGVNVPVASAILALVFPASYCVIDVRGWRAAYGEKRTQFSIPQYNRYRDDVATLARRLDWSTQETDLALWELDRRRSAR